jgi:hypothetical protein
MLYAAKCYWPQATETEIEQAADRAAMGESGYRGALHFPNDELVLYLFEFPSRAAVVGASKRAGIPCERVMETTWLAPQTRAANEQR